MKKYNALILFLTFTVFGSLFAFGNKEDSNHKQPDAATAKTGYNYEVSIANMTCALCDAAVEKQLGKIEWIQAVEGDHTTGLARLRIDKPLDKAEMENIINAELEKIDYHFVELKEL